MPFIQLPGDSTGKLLETVTPALSSAGSTMHREVLTLGDPASTAIATVTTSGGLLVTVNNPSTAVTVTNPSTAATVTQGTTPWVVHFTSGVLSSASIVALSSVHTITATAATNPWSSAPSFNLPVVSVSSGAVQIAPVSSGQILSFAYISSSSGNSNLVKGTPGAFHGFYAFNSTAAPRYLKIYNTTSAPTLGSTAGWLGTFGIPASTGGTGGAGGAHPLPYSIQASNGIAFTIVSGIETTSTGVIGNNDIAKHF